MDTTTTIPDQVFGYDVIDTDGNKLGSVDNVWVDDATGDLEFVAVKTGWLFGKNHIIPVSDGRIDNDSQAIIVPYSQDQVKGAPSLSSDAELSPDQEDDIYGYYGMSRSMQASPTGLGTGTASDYSAGTGTVADTEGVNVPLSEEQLNVGKREVEAGRVRLRKVVHTEPVSESVNLRREQVDIERVPVSGGMQVPSDAFQEDEVDVPVMREEPVVAKEARVTGQVNVDKTARTDTETVQGEVRREDVEVDEDDEIGTASTNPRY